MADITGMVNADKKVFSITPAKMFRFTWAIVNSKLNSDCSVKVDAMLSFAT